MAEDDGFCPLSPEAASDLSSLWDSDIEEVFYATFTARPTILRSAPSLPCALSGHAAATVADRLYVFGGQTGSCGPRATVISNLFTCDLSTALWSEIHCPLTPSARCGHTLTAVTTNGRHHLILYGGVSADDVWGDLWAYHCADFTWRRCCSIGSEEEPAPSARHGHTAVHSDALVVVYGGQGPDGRILADGVHLYHPEAQAWVRHPTESSISPPGRCGHSAVVHDGHMYVFGGQVAPDRGGARASHPVECNDLLRYSIASGTWTELMPYNRDLVPTPRSAHSATLYNGQMVVAGGWDQDHAVCGDVFSFDLVAERWSKYTFPLKSKDRIDPLQRRSHTACLRGGDELLLVGGCHYQSRRRPDVVSITLRPLSLKEHAAKFILEHNLPYREAPDASLPHWIDIPILPSISTGRPPKRRGSGGPQWPRAKYPRLRLSDYDSAGASSPSGGSVTSEDSVTSGEPSLAASSSTAPAPFST